MMVFMDLFQLQWQEEHEESVQCHPETNHHYTGDNGEENGEELDRSFQEISLLELFPKKSSGC